MIKLYSQPNCIKCKMLKEALSKKKIAYAECDNSEEMKLKNIKYVPVLEVEGKLLEFPEAFNWANSKE